MQPNTLICETRTYTEKSNLHYHSFCQLILPLQGNLFIKTDNHKLNLDEKHLFFLPPKCSHSFHSVKKNKFLVLDIPKENPVVLGDTFKNELYQLLDDRWKAIRYLLQEESRKADNRGLNVLLDYACRFLMEETRPTSLQYIHNNFAKPISLEKLASIENFNVTYYIEWFQRKTGMTPNAYIQKVRLEKAKEYLIDTKLSLLMISQLVGYNHQASLTRLFKKHEGLSPSEFRKKYRKMYKKSRI